MFVEELLEVLKIKHFLFAIRKRHIDELRVWFSGTSVCHMTILVFYMSLKKSNNVDSSLSFIMFLKNNYKAINKEYNIKIGLLF